MFKKPFITGLAAVSIFISAASCYAGTFTAFGSRTFIRGTGQPVTETASFNIKNPNTSYTLHIYNGGIRSELTRVSSAVIKLNGSTIFDTNDFNQQVSHLQRQVTVTKSNLLEAELRSIPDSGLTVLLEGMDNDPPIINIISPQGDSTVKTPKPDISLEYSDALSGIDLSTVGLTVDGLDVTAEAAITETGINYTPPVPLKDAIHTITASVSDKAGNSSEASASFTVKARQRPFIFPEPGFDAGHYYDPLNTWGENPWHYSSELQEVVDINGDGVLDVLVLHNKHKGTARGEACESKSKVSVIIGKGDGSFEDPTNVGETSGAESYNVDITDLNGDGYPDIIIVRKYIKEGDWWSGGCSSYAVAIETFLNNGDGSFSAGPSRNIGNMSYYRKVFAGDFNEDNHKDIAILEYDKIVIFRGKGDGSFFEPIESPLPPEVANKYVNDILPLDFNNDGMTDFVETIESGVAHNFQLGKVVLLLNNGDGIFRYSTILEESLSQYLSLSVSDLNKDGNLDINVLEQKKISLVNYDGYSFGVTILMGDGNGGIREQRYYDPSPGSYYRSILAKDFNRDNTVDVLLCQGNSDKAVVLLGNGDGTLNDQNPLISNAYCGKDIKTGDVDGDGIEDLISISSVLFGRGDGTFIDRKVIPTREYTSFMASVDFDGDKSPDIAMPGNIHTKGTLFSILPNKGNDWSGSLFQGISKYKTGNMPVSVKVGDLNGDGRLDSVTTDDLSGNLSVLLNTGDGNLKESGIYEVGIEPFSIALEDMNGDGRLDIIAANKGSNYVSILINNGVGTFQPQIKADITYKYGSSGMVIGDFNEDSRPDIIVGSPYFDSPSGATVLLAKADGTYLSKPIVIGDVRSVAKGDFNEDGHLDLATANTILFGKGDGTFYRAFNETYSGWYLLLVGDLNRDGHLDLVTQQKVYLGDGSGRFQVRTLPELNLGGHWSKLVDIDGDGNLDILSNSNYYGRIFEIWSGRGDGTFSNDVSLISDTINWWELATNSLDIGDMNGDAVPDIIYVDGSNLNIIPGTGSGGFPVETLFNDGSYRSSDSLAIADFNGDNNQDIVVSKREFDKDYNALGKTSAAVYWGTGNNTFRKGPVMETPYDWSEKIIAGDFNGDGKPDIVIGGWAYEGVSIFLNEGDGRFGSAIPYAIKDMIKDFWVADINGDGRLDIISNDVKAVSYGNYTYSLSIHVGKGDGIFQYQHSIPLMGGISGLTIKDFNSDGFADLAAAVWYDSSGFSNKIEVFVNNGDGTFNDPIVIEVEEFIYWDNSLVSDDFSQDGFIDLAVKLGTGIISLLTGNGDGTFNLSAKYRSLYGRGNMASNDFNMDGRPDIAVVDLDINLHLNTLPPLRTPPAPSAKLSGKAGDGTASLSWAANTEEDLEGYNVYRSLSAGGGYVKLNSTTVSSPTYTDSTATNGTAYYYTVAAVDKDNEESSYAFKVKVTPNPPDTIPPIVKINNPVNGGTVYSPKLFVLGAISETDAKVGINGITGTIQKNDNTFTVYDIPLSVGENTITTTAADAAGNSSTDSIKVIYVPTASISGVVKDELTGQPVQWTSVYITDSEKTQSLSTGSDGSYFFGKLVPGEVTIKAEAHKYDTFIEKKTLSSGEAMNFDILMPLIPATLKGTVYNASTNRGIAGATVTVTDRKKSQSVTTDSGGSYEVTDITPYDTTVTISKEGYETYTEDRNFSTWYAYWGYFYLTALPPSAPVGLTAIPGGGYITLTWNQSLEDLDGYNIYRSTTQGSGYTKLNSSPVNGIVYQDTDVAIGTTYYYVITAVNTSNQESGYSAEVSAAPRNVYSPTGLTATAGEGFVELNWSPSADSDISAYKIYRSTASGTGYSYITTTSEAYYKDKSVTGGTTYYYVATAVNTISKESPYSNEASATPEELKLSLSITYPKDGEWIKGSRIIVRGMVETASNEAGIVIETGDTKSGASARYLAEVNGQEFAAVVTLQEGFSYIKAIATDSSGNKSESSIMVSSSMPSPETVRLTANPESGIMTLKTITSPYPTRDGFLMPMPPMQISVMEVTLEAETSLPDSIISYAWDTNGDGWPEQVGTIPDITASYYSPGLYFPTVTVTDSKGNAYTATTIVNVLSKDEVDVLLKGKWGSMTDSLNKGDTATALAQISSDSQSTYQTMFAVLGEQLLSITATAREFNLISITDSRAKYKLRTVENGKNYSYEVIFIKDEDGLWKIREY